MKKDNKLLYKYLLSSYSKEYADEIWEGIKNPAKYSWICKDLRLIYESIHIRKNFLKDEEISKITEILEDELVNALLISQNSKCNPFKSIDTKSKNTHSSKI